MKKTDAARHRFFCKCDWVYKPGSVLTAIYLVVELLPRSSRLLGTVGQTYCSSTALLRIEFTALQCSHGVGGLLHRLFTLTSSKQAPQSSHYCEQQCSSVSLFLLSPLKLRFNGDPNWGEAVSLCCTCPEVTLGGRYPLSLPCEARTFLTCGLSPCSRGCPTQLQVYFTPFCFDCQKSCKLFLK